MKTILWWGRYDPDYSRNRIIRALQQGLGYQIINFHPRLSLTATFEASVIGIKKPDLVWVPCFRQRDMLAAAKWAKSRKIPIIFDPLISAWDKQVFERKKFSAESHKAIKLLKQETRQFQSADILIADSDEHARFFSDKFNIEPHRIVVIPVGAEEVLFKPEPLSDKTNKVIEVLFYGSFINLQRPQIIIEAARLCNNPNLHWHLLGSGPLLDECKKLAKDLKQVVFEDWIDYKQLPQRIHKADILLGIFGSSEKAARVIPNKVYQAMACARPVISRSSPAYPSGLQNGTKTGLYQIPEKDPQALCETVSQLARSHEQMAAAGFNARNTYEEYFSTEIIKHKLDELLKSLI
jgi:glycosyltransferase involved in cell wall biosynthesis